MKNLIGKSIKQYQILLKIRETGTRILFKVYDTDTKRNLALEVVKIENIDLSDASELFDLLKTQALQNAKLTQSNIAMLVDSGIFEDGLFFVYNFSPLQPLRRLFNQKFPWHTAARDLVAIAQALSYAHERGVIHGFLSPTNIILDENKNPYLFDFGFEQIILKFVTSRLPGSWINNSDYVYCSPEQLADGTADARSDVYSMGLILFEWMTGKVAFLEETALATLQKRYFSSIRFLGFEEVNKPEIKNLIQKCIAANPDDRYQSIQELSVLLAHGALDLNITPKMVNRPLENQVVVPSGRWRSVGFGFFFIVLITALIIVVAVITPQPFKQTASISLSFTPEASATKLKLSATATPGLVNPTPTNLAPKKPSLAPNKISYPVLEGTALPASLPKISPENSARLITLSRWGIGKLNCLAISPDGSFFAAGSPSGVFLFKTDGVTLQKYLNTSSWVNIIEFSSDGKKLAIGDRDGLIVLWDTASWEEIGNYSGHKGGILDLSFSPDGSELASVAKDNKLIKWQVGSEPISVDVNGVSSLVYSSDGLQIISGGNDFKVNLWDAKNLNLLKTITYSAKVIDIKVIKDTDILVVGGSDRRIVLVDKTTGERSKPFIGLQNDLSYLAVSPNGLEIVASDVFGGIVAWDKSGNLLWKIPTRVEGFTPSFISDGVDHSLVFSFDSSTITSGLRNGTLRFYKALTGEEIMQNSSLNNTVEKIIVSHNSNFVLSQNENGELKIWSLRNGEFLYQLKGTMKLGGVFSSNDKFFAVATDAATVKVFETTTGNEKYIFNGLQNIQTIQFIQNDKFLVAGNDPTMRIWSMISGQEIKTNKDFNGQGCTVVYDLKGEPIFLFTKYHYVFSSNQMSFCTFQKISWMRALSINEQNAFIAYGGNSKLGITGPGIIAKEMDDVNRINIEKVAINAEKTLLAVALDDHTIGIWDTAKRKKIMQLFGHDGSITDLQFSPDGKLLLSASEDGTIRVWGIP